MPITISQEYDRLETDDIQIPLFSPSEIPVVTEVDVQLALESLDTNKSNVENDVPAKILKTFCKANSKTLG